MDNLYLDLWFKNTERWVKVDKKDLPLEMKNARLSDLIVDQEVPAIEESSLFYLYYLLLRWPPYTESEENDLLNKFKDELKEIYTKKGVSEVMAIKEILIHKRKSLKNDLAKTPDEFDFKGLVKILESLITLFNKKLGLIEKLEMAYAINGEIELFEADDNYTLVEDNLIAVLINNVSESISSHPNATTSKPTIELFLKTHIDFKKSSIREKRNLAIERCINEKLGDHIEEELRNVATGTAINWKNQLDEMIEEVERLLPLFAQ